MENGVEAFQLLVHIEGVALKVIAERLHEREWQLAVQNERGINGVWFENYSDARQAIDAGIRAIDEEGVQAFCDVDGFEYLLD